MKWYNNILAFIQPPEKKKKISMEHIMSSLPRKSILTVESDLLYLYCVEERDKVGFTKQNNELLGKNSYSTFYTHFIRQKTCLKQMHS